MLFQANKIYNFFYSKYLMYNNKKMRRFIKTELGFSIIQIIVVLGLMAISMMVTVDMLTQHNKQLLTTRILISRDSVVNIIKLNAMKVSVLKKTAETDAVNNLFHHCVFGKNQDSTVTVNGCLGGGIEHRLKLIDLSGAIVAGPAARDTFPADPLYYESDGSVCSGNISKCPIQAEVVFSATCPGASPPVNCDQAATVVVKYIISQNQAA